MTQQLKIMEHEDIEENWLKVDFYYHHCHGYHRFVT